VTDPAAAVTAPVTVSVTDPAAVVTADVTGSPDSAEHTSVPTVAMTEPGNEVGCSAAETAEAPAFTTSVTIGCTPTMATAVPTVAVTNG
jgi:hypothetical protein